MSESNETRVIRNIFEEEIQDDNFSWCDMKEELIENIHEMKMWKDIVKEYLIKKNIVKDTQSDKELFDIVKKCYKDNGMSGRYALRINSTAKEFYQSVERDILSKKVMFVSREKIIGLAFGLGMTIEETEYMLTKVLLQMSFNPKSSYEMIAYYVLKNYTGKERITKYDEFVEFYSKIEDTIGCGTDTKFFDDNFNNIDLIKKDDIAFKKCLELCKQDDYYNKYSSNIKDLFSKKIYKIKGKLGVKDEEEQSVIHNILIEEGKKNTDKFASDIFSREVLENIFVDSEFSVSQREDISEKGYNITASFLNNYLLLQTEEDRHISRKGLILVSFVCYILENRESFHNKKRIDIVDDFEEYVSVLLSTNHMFSDLYLKDPFESFILLCLLHTHPYEYFCSNYYLYFRQID